MCNFCINIIEKSGLGTLFRKIQGAILNIKYPEYNLFNALALKSGPPGTPVFEYETDGLKVKIMPMGMHLDLHGEAITTVDQLKADFFKITKGQKQGKVDWIFENKIIGKKYLSEFVFPEGPARLHYLPKAKCLAIGGGRNRIVTLMRFGYFNAKQLKEAVWNDEKKKYVDGDVIINYPGKPVWDDVPGRTDIQDWVDKTKRWDDAYAAGLRFKVRDIYNMLFK